MGVYLTIRSASVDQIAALDAKPELLPVFFDAAALEDVLPRPSFWQRLTGRRPSVPESLLDQSNCMEIGLLEYHQQLWAFLRDAVNEQQGCVIWID